MPLNARAQALALLADPDPQQRCDGAQALAAAVLDGQAHVDPTATFGDPDGLPGRGARPRLVPHLALKPKSVHTLEGRAALLHAIAHIEANAIALALDAVFRFPDLPQAYYLDWLRVAAEEALHWRLLNEHLHSLGYAYGDFDAHDGLWQMAWATRHDWRARMALVPRTLEARGLDATPPLQRKFAQAGDTQAVLILERILHDEIGHVAIGNHWYRWACARDGVDPETDFPAQCTHYGAPRPRRPLNLIARAQAGFTAPELQRLEASAQ